MRFGSSIAGSLLRLLALLVLCTGARAAPMGADEARHLLVRTGFAASAADVEAYAKLTRAQAVERLFATVRTEPVTRPPAELDEWTPRSQIRALPQQERRAVLLKTIQQGQELRGWWLNEMLTTPSPFTEKMTLFWHNHFVSSLQKVRPTRLMYRQNLLLRKQALGNFGEMLHAISRDPAMIVYLDNASNRKGSPNENFAREVMELFTLGEGRYGEQDIKEAARAFTGWGIDGETGAFVFRPALHDAGTKTVLGRTGALDGDDVLEILLAQRETAELIVRKLWEEFVSPKADAREVARIADAFRAGGYEIRTAMRMLLTADAFYAADNRASLVKSPIDLIVGTVRQFDIEVGDPYAFVVISRQLGQDLMAPPNVKGWPGGEHWINASTLLARKQVLERLFRVSERSTMAAASGTMNAAAVGAQGNAMQAQARSRFQRAMAEVRFDEPQWSARSPALDHDALATLMLPAKPLAAPDPSQDRLAAIRRLALDPVYQLK
jgi:uncharacterized protein (DUF1800 family)